MNITQMSTSNPELTLLRPTPELIDTVEHLQAISDLNTSDWLDSLKITWADYCFFRSGRAPLPDESLEKLLDLFQIELPELIQGNIDFSKLSTNFSDPHATLPEQFTMAAHGRLRSTITAIQFLECKYGWRLKHDVLKRFKVPESSLMDPFAPISIRLITDICQYLRRRQFSDHDFFEMGAYSYVTNRHSLIGKIYSEMSDYREAFDAFARTLMPMFETNCTYEFDMLDSQTGVVTSKSNRDIAAQLNAKFLGSESICQFKAGIWACLTAYYGLPLPKVTHPQCEHRGDGICRYIFDFSGCEDSAGRPQALLA